MINSINVVGWTPLLTGVLLFGEDVDTTKSQMPAVKMRRLDVVTAL